MLTGPIPYIDIPPKVIYLPDWFPFIEQFTIYAFGPLVTLGVLLGMVAAMHFAKVRNINEKYALDELTWMLVLSVLMAHWVAEIFYHPQRMMANPMVLLDIPSSLSSSGGFAGAFIGMWWYLHRKKQPILIYADMNIMGVVIGFLCGRLGCSLVHDHPGKIVEKTNLLAVGPWPCSCPEGRSLVECCTQGQQLFRYDLGLIEFIFLLGLSVFLYFVYPWRTAAPGRITGWVALCYGVARFFFDFLRGNDELYWGLTPAQYMTFAIIAAGVWLLFIRQPQERDLQWSKQSK